MKTAGQAPYVRRACPAACLYLCPVGLLLRKAGRMPRRGRPGRNGRKKNRGCRVKIGEPAARQACFSDKNKGKPHRQKRLFAHPVTVLCHGETAFDPYDRGKDFLLRLALGGQNWLVNTVRTKSLCTVLSFVAHCQGGRLQNIAVFPDLRDAIYGFT